MTCERCARRRIITVGCSDSKGPWRLCVECLLEIDQDNAELRARPPRREASR